MFSTDVIISWLYSSGNMNTYAIKTLNLPITYSTFIRASVLRNGYATADFSAANACAGFVVAHTVNQTHTLNTISVGGRYNIDIILVGY